MHDRSRDCPRETDPILVYGAPRSGTTYVREILNAHPEVGLTNEFRVFEWLHRALVEVTQDELALFLEREPFTEWLRSSLPALVRSYYRARFPAAKWWGDKNPHYIKQLGTLRTIMELFPNVRCIHVHRDPRAVLASQLRKKTPGGQPWTGLEEAHYAHRDYLRNALDFGKEAGAGKVWTIRYEALIQDDEATAMALLDWLGIPPAEQVVAFTRAQGRQRTPFSDPTTDLAKAGSKPAARSAWRENVPPERQRESLRFLAPLLLELGYEDETSLEQEIRSCPD